MEREIVWRLPVELVEKSNVKRFMDRHGTKSYEETVKNFAENIWCFWDAEK